MFVGIDVHLLEPVERRAEQLGHTPNDEQLGMGLRG